MTIRRRLDNSPAALPKKVADITRQLEQDRASLRIRSSVITIGGSALFERDGILYFRDTDGTERPVVPTARSAPFPNNSFEAVDGTGKPVNWSDFWRSADATVTTDNAWATLGSRSLKLTNGLAANSQSIISSGVVTVVDGATLTIVLDAKGVGLSPQLDIQIVSNTETGDPNYFAAGSTVTGTTAAPTSQGAEFTAVLTIPAGHTRVRLFLVGGSALTSAVVSINVDNVGVSGGEQQVAGHSDYFRRAAQALVGGGTRTATSAGDIAWSTAFRVIGAGMQDDEALGGYFDITMPANSTVIPVHQSTARTSYTVASNLIRLNTNESLWYELPLGAGATSQPARFHIVAATLADGYVIRAGWILVCARDGNGTYRWGDGQTNSRAFHGAEGVYAGAQPPAGALPIEKYGTVVVTTNGSGVATVTYPVAFPNGIVAVIVSPEFANTLTTAVPIQSSSTLAALVLTARNQAGATINSTPIRVMYHAIGW